jgi:tRNA pseudouridine55 synthase
MSKPKRTKIAYNGWVNLWKPVGLSSMQAVAAVRRHLNAAKIGHAGTLDPLADGILPIALGEATKLIPLLQDGLKTYRFGVNWGVATNTDDTEGEVTETSPIRPTAEQINAVLPEFVGLIQQVPPPYSAIKINGQRAYALARKGEEFEISAREIYIDSLQLIDSSNPDMAILEVTCGTGTYVRSLARDMAQVLGTFAHCAFITRTNVGKFTEKESISLENLQQIPYTDLGATLWPLVNGLDDILAIAVNDTEKQRLQRGQDVSFLSKMDSARLPETHDPSQPLIAVCNDDVVAICSLSGATLHPVRVLNI